METKRAYPSTRQSDSNGGRSSCSTMTSRLSIGPRQTSDKLTRSPDALLKACLPAWREVLRKGGAIALAWNVNVLPRAEAEKILDDAGFTVLRGGVYDRLLHRVDQAIMRDVILARK